MPSASACRAEVNSNNQSRDEMLGKGFGELFPMDLMPSIECLDKCCEAIPKKSVVPHTLDDMGIVVRSLDREQIQTSSTDQRSSPLVDWSF